MLVKIQCNYKVSNDFQFKHLPGSFHIHFDIKNTTSVKY